MDDFEKMSQELENQIATEKKVDEEGDLGTQIVKAVAGVISKSKGGKEARSDLSAEQVKDDKSHIEAGKDPAQSPKPANGKAADTKKYMSGKGKVSASSDDDEDEPAPKFKKKMKKSVEADEDEDEDQVDATEFMETLGESVDELRADLHEVKKALAVSLDLQSSSADTEAKDKLLVTIAKGLNFLIEENKSLKKALTEQSSLVKAVAQMPGMPRAVNLFQAVGTDDIKKSSSISKAQEQTLFSAASAGKITREQYKEAKKTGDLSCLAALK